MAGAPVEPGTRDQQDQQDQRKPFSWPLYPILAALFPVLAVFSSNTSLVPAGDILRPLAAAALGSLMFVLAASALWRNWERGAASACAASVWFWLYAPVSRFLAPHMTPGAVPYVFAAIGLLLAAAAGWLKPPTKALNTLALFVVGFSAASAAWQTFSPAEPRVKAASSLLQPAPPGPRPDVFHIIADGFGSEQGIRHAFGLDMGWFTEELEKRGFQVAPDARTNFIQTELSVPSALNLDYIQNLLPTVPKTSNDRRPLKLITESPRVEELLGSLGYRMLGVGSGFDAVSFGPKDILHDNIFDVTLFESTLLAMTPLDRQDEFRHSMFDQKRESVLRALETTAMLGRRTATPRLIVAHVLSPHPPFVFGAGGEQIRPKGGFGYWDASDYITHVGTAEDYKQGYSGQVVHTARLLLETIDEILAAGKGRPPIIILQGDHGPKSRLLQADLAKTDIHEAFPILYAVHAPKDVPLQVEPDATPVNTYRKVLRGLGVQGFPDLPNQSWFSPFPRPFEFTEVTKELNQGPPKAEPAQVQPN